MGAGDGGRFQDSLWTPEPRDAQVPTQNGRAQQNRPHIVAPDSQPSIKILFLICSSLSLRMQNPRNWEG